MNRYKIRENTFKMLFLTEFHNEEEIKQQIVDFFHWDDLKEIHPDDRSEIEARFAKIIEKIPMIDEAINQIAKGWKTERMGKVDLTILRLAVFEIKYDDTVPSGVAINEAVELAKKYGQDESPAFINGILAKLI